MQSLSSTWVCWALCKQHSAVLQHGLQKAMIPQQPKAPGRHTKLVDNAGRWFKHYFLVSLAYVRLKSFLRPCPLLPNSRHNISHLFGLHTANQVGCWQTSNGNNTETLFIVIYSQILVRNTNCGGTCASHAKERVPLASTRLRMSRNKQKSRKRMKGEWRLKRGKKKRYDTQTQTTEMLIFEVWRFHEIFQGDALGDAFKETMYRLGNWSNRALSLDRLLLGSVPDRVKRVGVRLVSGQFDVDTLWYYDSITLSLLRFNGCQESLLWCECQRSFELHYQCHCPPLFLKLALSTPCG